MSDPVTWLKRYGPRQLRDVLDLTEWQFHRAREAGNIPDPDLGAGKWSGPLVQKLHRLRSAIRLSAGSVADLGAERAAEHLTERLGVDVAPHAVAELARAGRLLIVGDFKGHPLYCGRGLREFADLDAIARADVDGEMVTTAVAADRLGIRGNDLRHLVNLGWLHPRGWARGPFTAKKYPPNVPLYRFGDLIALLTDPTIDWDAARAVRPGQRSPLATLPDRSTTTA